MAHDASWLKDHIRDIPDFPKPGVVFKDITPLLADVDAFRFAVDAIADHYAGNEVHKVLGVEARGSIMIIDDVLATGGTASATVRLFERLGATVQGLGFVIELAFLYGRDKIAGHDAVSLLVYD